MSENPNQNSPRIPPRHTDQRVNDDVLWEVVEALIDTHSIHRVLEMIAQVAFQRGSEWREAARMIQTTAAALPEVLKRKGA